MSKDEGHIIITLPKAPKVERRPGFMPVQTLEEDGTWTTEYVELDPDFEARLAEYRKEIQELKDAGTPYWCIHEGRALDHPKAKWMEDRYEPGDPGYDGIHHKHGVICTECGGYLQEG